MIYGYARVSTAAQDYAAQLAELEIAGCGQVFTEAASAAGGRRRPQLAKVLAILQPGDVLIVVHLNRLARSARDALNSIAEISAKGAGFRSLAQPWADTTTPAGRFMVTVFSGLAEFDREEILARTAAGRAHAKARGVQMGRRSRLSHKQKEFVRQERAKVPPTSISQLQALLKVSRSTICRAAREPAGPAPAPEPGGQLDLEEVLRGADK